MAAKSPAIQASKAKVAPAKKVDVPAKATPKSSKAQASKASPSAPAARKTEAKPVANKATPAKSSVKPAVKSPAKPAAKPAAAKPAPKQAPAKPPATKQAPAKPPATKQAPAKPAAKKAATAPTTPSKASVASAAPAAARGSHTIDVEVLPKPKFNKEGLGYTKDFDLAFIKAQYEMLQQERIHLTGQAKRLEAEAHQLVEEAEMGDVQFDDEGGEGDTMVVERERDLALSAQARDAVAEIDAALVRIKLGTYGYSLLSGRPIPKERLEAIPWSSVLVEEKVGGIGRR